VLHLKDVHEKIPHARLRQFRRIAGRRRRARDRQSLRRRADRHPRHHLGAGRRTQVGITDYQFFIQTDGGDQSRQFRAARWSTMTGKARPAINTAIFSRSGGSQGIGLCDPCQYGGVS